MNSVSKEKINNDKLDPINLLNHDIKNFYINYLTINNPDICYNKNILINNWKFLSFNEIKETYINNNKKNIIDIAIKIENIHEVIVCFYIKNHDKIYFRKIKNNIYYDDNFYKFDFDSKKIKKFGLTFNQFYTFITSDLIFNVNFNIIKVLF